MFVAVVRALMVVAGAALGEEKVSKRRAKGRLVYLCGACRLSAGRCRTGQRDQDFEGRREGRKAQCACEFGGRWGNDRDAAVDA